MIRGKESSIQCHVMLYNLLLIVKYYVCDCPWTKSFVRGKKISIESENRMCVCSALCCLSGEVIEADYDYYIS